MLTEEFEVWLSIGWGLAGCSFSPGVTRSALGIKIKH
jgi:hypothetical protein